MNQFTNTKRVVICHEGQPSPSDHFMEPGCLKTPEDRLPVTFGLEHEELLGWASDMERDVETGAISFELHLKDDRYFDEDSFSFSLFCNDLVQKQSPGEQTHVVSASPRGVTVFGYLRPNSVIEVPRV